MTRDRDRDPDALADEIILLDGPHDADNVIAAAGVVAELVRRLNHATQAYKCERVLFYPSNVDRLVSLLAGAAYGLPQLCRQLAARMDVFAADERLGVDNLGEALAPAGVALDAQVDLYIAAQGADAVADALSRARRSTSRLTYREAA